MNAAPDTSTIERRCGHRHAYDLTNVPLRLREGVLNALTERDCLSCRRAQVSRLGEIDVGSPRNGATDRGQNSEWEAWERREQMPELCGADWAIVAGSRVRFVLMNEADLWCSDREFSAEEFAQRLLAPARRHLDAEWWTRNYDCAPGDLEEILNSVDDESDLDEDKRGAR